MIIPNHQSSLQHWIDWLLQLHPKEVDLGLDRIRLVAESMQLLHPVPFVISVAGTNGKGSSVAMLVSILKAAGYQVGAYTSPHIQTFNERIQINGLPVSDAAITDAFAQIEAARGGVKLTYFEFATLAALVIFKQSTLDVLVLEVGLGGRLDAVNVIDADAALITAIGIDHIEWLGDDRSVIATEKAGIMRTGNLAVCSEGAPPESLLAYAKKHAVPLMQLNRDFALESFEEHWSIIGMSDAFNKRGGLELKNLPPPSLKGAFQLNNAAGVVALLSLQQSLIVGVDAIVTGLQQAKHPGRLDHFYNQEQSWLVDVAHNPQSAEALADYLRQGSSNNELESGYTAIFSVLNDKDALPMIKMMAPFVKKWVIIDLLIPRATSIEALTMLLMDAGVSERDIFPQNTMAQAVTFAEKTSNSPVLVWGSFFTVSQVYACLDNRLSLL
ncbi:MAG TPA: bifunctional folylpolyglutamate synthase/dihydrofolate synthase [Thiomicrorhabdus sp.]|nr:bifunctional folylpolyglutamate synthase/dihydrofolate synthase [Thiomicrorhabdus sp.]